MAASTEEIRELLIVYGSQTGNAQDLAERVWRKSKAVIMSSNNSSSGIKTKLGSLDRLTPTLFDDDDEQQQQRLVIFVCSTTGQGDVPDNMATFWRTIMRRSVPAAYFAKLRVAVIGLGDSSYDKYNFVAKKLHKRLVQLAARPVLELCLCDEQQADGVEATFSAWLGQLCRYIAPLHHPSDNAIPATSTALHKYTVKFLDKRHDDEEMKTTGDDAADDDDGKATEARPLYARLSRNERLTPADHWQDVRLIEFDCSGSGGVRRVAYKAGDVLALRPSNLPASVDKFMRAFEHLRALFLADLEQPIRVESNYPDELDVAATAEIGHVRTVGDLVRNYFDLNSVPRLSFFEMLSELAPSGDAGLLEKEKLVEFLSDPDGLQDLYNYCHRPRRTIVEILYDFPHTCANIRSLDTLLDLIPAIKPRSFSIASSPSSLATTGRIELLVAVVEYRTRMAETRKGTCSYWLSTLDQQQQPQVRVPVWIRAGAFELDSSRPLVCIGPGTGVAPFRSIINERFQQQQQQQTDADTGECSCWLFFGCRSKRADFFFGDEWSQLEERERGRMRLSVAFSRDQAHKVYVQDEMLAEWRALFELFVERRAQILIAGNSKRMPQDVRAIIERIVDTGFRELKGETSADADWGKQFLASAERTKQIQLETWS